MPLLIACIAGINAFVRFVIVVGLSLSFLAIDFSFKKCIEIFS